MQRRSIRSTEGPGRLASEALRQRELEVVREIAHAFLTATQPLEVYRLALARVTPLVRASFSSVFLRDSADENLLRLVCAQNWPQSSARFLSQLRIRVGRGPTGRAVKEQVAVEVEDVFAEPSLRDWWEPARELGFASLISLPLRARGEVAGALSFYFQGPRRFDEEERELLALVADQLSATVEKATLIEDLKAANEQLAGRNQELSARVLEAEESKRLKDEFLANVSHELRTPLTSILGYTYLLSAGHTGPITEEQKAAVAKIERAAMVLLQLIDDLLDLSQLKLGRAQPVYAEEDGRALAERAARAIGPPPPGTTFRLIAPEEPLPLQTDGQKVVKILENLLSNAFKFTPEGQVTLLVRRATGGQEGEGCKRGEAGPTPAAAAPTAGWVEWVVQDTGIGIRPEDLPKIFDEFRQVDGSVTRPYGGAGLGLALSLRLAKLLGGTLTAESEPGRGSTFTLRLPPVPPVTSLG